MLTKETAINIVKSFLSECNSNGLFFNKVYIFGSIAKGDIHEWSDIDLLLVSDKFSDNVFENLKLYSAINIKYPVIETHPYPLNYYYEGDSFIDEIMAGSIEIVNN
jgi:predicted nucleotidyltransferase